MISCPSCGHTNPDDSRFCGACGTALAGDIPCAACGWINPRDINFCRGCGARLSTTPGSTVEATTSEPKGPQRESDRPPSTFGSGRYEVKRFLGEGGRKRVYQAHDSRLGRDVAIAVIKTEGLDEAGRGRLRREAQAMGALGDHPHIVSVHDIGEDAGQPYIVSQYMEGGSIADLLDRAPAHRLPVDTCMQIADQICQALHYAHARELVHRDLKPANVWLTADGTAKLGDFGLAVALGHTRLTAEGMVIGTVAYMPPEQAMGREPDARSDLYSLGAMLYEMLTGRPPFVGDEAVGVISQHINTPAVAPSWHNPEVSRELESLVMQLLAKSPTERPSSAASVLERMRHISSVRSDEHAAPGPASSPATTALPRLAWGPFVGRREELAKAKAAVDSMLGGQGKLVMIAGESGVGKSRLAEETGIYAQLRGAQVLVGRCYEGEGAPAFWPWVQIIRSYVHERDPDSLLTLMGTGASDIAQVVSEVRAQLPGLPAPPAMEPEQARFRLFDSVTTFLRNAATIRPLVIVLDDLHWSDKPSLLLMRFLARELKGARVLVLGCYQDAQLERRHPLLDVLAELWRERPYERLRLEGMTLEEVVLLLEAIAQHELDDAGRLFAQALHHETEGNPFFMQEIIRHLVEAGHIYHHEGRWVSDAESIEELGIAEGVREVVGRRLSRLSGECNEVLTIAAAIGREFDMRVIQAVSERSIDEVLEVLEEAIGSRLIVDVPGTPERYTFSQSLIRHALYDDVSVIRRLRLHHRIAGALEAFHAQNLEPHVGEIARHLIEAGPHSAPEKTCEFARRAGDRALVQLAYEEAASHYALALEALDRADTADQERRGEILLALGDARWRAGNAAQSKKSFTEAAGIARHLGSAEMLARAALGYGGGLGGLGLMDRADEAFIALLEEALVALGPEDGALRVRVLARLALELYFTAEVSRRTALSSEAVEIAARLGDPAVQLLALYCRFEALLGPDSLNERLVAADEILRLAREVGDKEMAFHGHRFRLNTLLETGEIDGVEREIEAMDRLARELRMPLLVWQVLTFRAMRALLSGDFDEGERLTNEALAIGESLTRETAMGIYGAQLIMHRWGIGRLDELVGVMQMTAEQYPWIPAWRAALLFIHAEAGRAEEAVSELEHLAADDFARIPRDGNWMLAVFLISQSCRVIGDRPRARVLYDLLAPFEDRYVTVAAGAVCVASVTTVLAILAAYLDRWDEAERLMLESVERNNRVGARPVVARSLYEFASFLLERNDPGDRSRSLALLDDALALTQDLGMKALTERCLALKLEVQGVSGIDVRSSIHVMSTAVQEERPDLRPHAAPDGTVTVVFTDMQSSTEMVERLGDRRAQEVFRAHSRIVREALAQHDGYEVKSAGDGFMLAFSSARRALAFAIDVQRSLARYNEAGPEERIHVRMGLHTGEVIREAGDFFGRHVILAARIAGEAGGDEILCSAMLKELTESSGEFSFEELSTIGLKGLSGTHSVYRVAW